MNRDDVSVFVARWATMRDQDSRAFSTRAKAKNWLETELKQSIEFEEFETCRWVGLTDRVYCEVEKIKLEDPISLQARYPEAFGE